MYVWLYAGYRDEEDRRGDFGELEDDDEDLGLDIDNMGYEVRTGHPSQIMSGGLSESAHQVDVGYTDAFEQKITHSKGFHTLGSERRHSLKACRMGLAEECPRNMVTALATRTVCVCGMFSLQSSPATHF